MLKYITSFYLLVLSVNNIYSQNPKEDFHKINQAYISSKDMSMTISYTVFESHNSLVPIETSTGEYKQHGNFFYSKIQNVESLSNSTHYIVVDNEDKLIVVANPQKTTLNSVTMVDIEQSISMCSSVEYINLKGSSVGYKLNYNKNIASEYDVIEIYFSKQSFQVEKIIVFYRNKINFQTDNVNAIKDKPRLEITFSNITKKAITDVAFFSELRFVEQKKGKYYPVNTYREYELINQKTELK